MPNSLEYELPLALGVDDPNSLESLIHRVSNLLNKQQNELLAAQNLGVPSRTVTTLMVLRRKGPSSVTSIARVLTISHQLAAQRVKILKKLDLIIEKDESGDRRVTILELTETGEKLSNAIEVLWRDVDKAYQDMFQETGFNLNEVLGETYRALTKSPLSERIRMAKSLFGKFKKFKS